MVSVTTISRNSPCPCNSGRKYKKCCINKKPRITRITGYSDTPMTLNNLRIDPKNGTFELCLENKKVISQTVVSEINYEREKKEPKVVSRVSVDPERIVAGIHRNLIAYKHVVAIDTNDRDTEHGVVCVMASVYAATSTAEYKIRLTVMQHQLFEFWNPSISPEKIGWVFAMLGIMERQEYKNGEKFAVIVDSDLDNINRYNRREIEIIENFVLPDNIVLMYGSSDHRNDSVINGLIFLADKFSNEVHEKISANYYLKSGDYVSPLFSDGRHWDGVTNE